MTRKVLAPIHEDRELADRIVVLLRDKGVPVVDKGQAAVAIVVQNWRIDGQELDAHEALRALYEASFQAFREKLEAMRQWTLGRHVPPPSRLSRQFIDTSDYLLDDPEVNDITNDVLNRLGKKA